MFIFVDKNNCVFERTSYRVPGEKHPRARKVCIGKKNPDGSFTGNSYYIERCAKEKAEKKISELEEKVKEFEGIVASEEKKDKAETKLAVEAVSTRKKSGLTYAIESIMDKLSIFATLEEVLGKDKAEIITSLIQFMIVTKSGAMDDFSFFDADHTHCCEHDISSPAISRLFSSISEDLITDFFKKLHKKAPKDMTRGAHYASFDSTAFSSYSEDIDIVAPSKGKQDPNLEHFSLSALYDTRTNMCGYYRLYRGNIPDVKTVSDLVDVANAMNLSFNNRLIFDRGYTSWENIYLVHKKLKSDVMMMVKSNFSIYSKAIEKAGTSFKNNSALFIPQQGVFGTTATEKLTLKVDKKEEDIHAFLHVYYSPERYSSECSELEDTIDFEIERVNKLISEQQVAATDLFNKTCINQNLRKYIKVIKTSNREAVLEKDCDAVAKRLANAGYFVILTTEYLSAKDTLLIYRGRDNVERLFNVVKNNLGFTRADVKNDNTLQGKMFIVMLSAMVITYIKNCIREHRQELTRKMTYNKACLELESIYSHKLKGKTAYCEISDRQKLLLSSLGLNLPEAQISVKLKKSYTKKKPKE